MMMILRKYLKENLQTLTNLEITFNQLQKEVQNMQITLGNKRHELTKVQDLYYRNLSENKL